MKRRIYIIAGEFPPTIGGVADHCFHMASTFTQRGYEVTVFAPGNASACMSFEVVNTSFDREGLLQLKRHLQSLGPDDLILFHYVPQGFGRPFHFQLMSLISQQSTGIRCGVVHEPYYPFRWADPPKRWLLSSIHRLQLRLFLSACDHLFVATSAWARYLPKQLAAKAVPIPVGASVKPEEIDEDGQDRFVTFGSFQREQLPIWASIAEQLDGRDWTLIGRGSEEMGALLRDQGFDVVGLGCCSPQHVIKQLACHRYAVQWYPDGVTTRRSSLLTCLASGLTVFGNSGFLTEPEWGLWGCLRSWREPEDLGHLLTRAAWPKPFVRSLYDKHLSIDVAVEAILAQAVDRNRIP